MSKNSKIKIKKGDNVKVIAGDYKGSEGEVLKVYPEKQRVLVSDVNIVKKHQKPTNESPGGIIEQPAPIHISNVMLIAGGQPTRVGRKVEDDKIVRYAKHNGETI